jgi:hypothetical protein
MLTLTAQTKAQNSESETFVPNTHLCFLTFSFHPNTHPHLLTFHYLSLHLSSFFTVFQAFGDKAKAPSNYLAFLQFFKPLEMRHKLHLPTYLAFSLFIRGLSLYTGCNTPVPYWEEMNSSHRVSSLKRYSWVLSPTLPSY